MPTYRRSLSNCTLEKSSQKYSRQSAPCQPDESGKDHNFTECRGRCHYGANSGNLFGYSRSTQSSRHHSSRYAQTTVWALIGIEVGYFTVLLMLLSIRFIENGKKVPRSFCTRFIFILFIALARYSLGHDHCSTIDLWLNVRSFCSCSCAHALTTANCYYALWRQISHVPATLLWQGILSLRLLFYSWCKWPTITVLPA